MRSFNVSAAILHLAKQSFGVGTWDGGGSNSRKPFR